jgi:hypothetical protein
MPHINVTKLKKAKGQMLKCTNQKESPCEQVQSHPNFLVESGNNNIYWDVHFTQLDILGAWWGQYKAQLQKQNLCLQICLEY